MAVDRIQGLIEAAIPGASVQIANPGGDEQHFEAVVVSDRFDGLSLVEQHQMVMDALKEEFAGRVHALQLKTYTPQKWQAAQNRKNT